MQVLFAYTVCQHLDFTYYWPAVLCFYGKHRNRMLRNDVQVYTEKKCGGGGGGKLMRGKEDYFTIV